MTTVGIIGSRGRLGRAVTADLRSADYAVREYDLPEFDGGDFVAMERVIRDADIWINCAEISARFLRSDSPRQAFAANIMLPGHLGELAAQAGRYAIHISTSAVFGGLPQPHPFAEEDEPYSIDGYERSRSNGEKAFLLHRPPGAILRLGWLYGLPDGDFIARWRLAASAGRPMVAEPGMSGTPTSLTLVLRGLRCLLARRAEGIFHLAARGCATRAEAAACVGTALKSRVPVLEASETTPELDPVFPGWLQCRKIDAVLDFKRPAWQPALLEYLHSTPGRG